MVAGSFCSGSQRPYPSHSKAYFIVRMPFSVEKGRALPPMAHTKPTESRASYAHFLAIATRWMDNDIYGHVNNVIYYSYFDTVINEYLIRSGVLDIHESGVIGIAVETHCQFHKSLVFPDIIDAGLRVAKLGNSSVRYEIGLFKQDDDEPAATGHFVHVFVDRASMRPLAMPPDTRSALARLTFDRPT